MSDLVIRKFKKYGHNETECPYWDQVSLNHTNPNPWYVNVPCIGLYDDCRLSTEHNAMLQEDNTRTMGEIISALCTDTSESMEYIATTKTPETPSGGAHVKVAGFKVKVIASLVDTFVNQASMEAVVNMLGVYYRLVIRSTCICLYKVFNYTLILGHLE